MNTTFHEVAPLPRGDLDWIRVWLRQPEQCLMRLTLLMDMANVASAPKTVGPHQASVCTEVRFRSR
jgi:hypothetical protein